MTKLLHLTPGRPKGSYENPCEVGAPATDEDGSLVPCGVEADCPLGHACTTTRRNGLAVCCPDPHYVDNSTDSELMEVSFQHEYNISISTEG